MKKTEIAKYLILFGLVLLVPMILVVAVCNEVVYSVSDFMNGHM